MEDRPQAGGMELKVSREVNRWKGYPSVPLRSKGLLLRPRVMLLPPPCLQCRKTFPERLVVPNWIRTRSKDRGGREKMFILVIGTNRKEIYARTRVPTREPLDSAPEDALGQLSRQRRSRAARE